MLYSLHNPRDFCYQFSRLVSIRFELEYLLVLTSDMERGKLIGIVACDSNQIFVHHIAVSFV